jgi:hypothetical protein
MGAASRRYLKSGSQFRRSSVLTRLEFSQVSAPISI